MSESISSALLRVKLVDAPDDLFKNLESIPRGDLMSAIKAMPYSEFVETRYWQAVAITVKERAGSRCQICNTSQWLEAHHRTYENHGCEHRFLEDLTCLCRGCHGKFHAAKKKEAALPPAPLAPGEKRKKPEKFFRKAAIKLMINQYVLQARGFAEVNQMLSNLRDQKLRRKKERSVARQERAAIRDTVYIKR